MVRDKNGRKMSKSTGNVIDPMEVIHGCLLSDLLKKIDEGNLPEKEVRTSCAFCALTVFCIRALRSRCIICGVLYIGCDVNTGPCFRAHIGP